MKNAAINLAILVLSLLVFWGLAEWALRSIAPAGPFGSAYPLFPYRTRYLQVTRKGVTHQVRQSTNRWGLRGDDPPADGSACETLVAVGGSTTQCYYVDDAKTWPYRLQQALAGHFPCVWVGNAGLDGHSTRGHVAIMRDVVSRIRPRVVLFLVGANDLGISLSAEERHLYDKPGNWRWTLFRRSRLIQILYTWKLIRMNRVHQVTSVSRDFRFEPFAGKDPEGDPAALLPQLPEFESNVHRLIAQAREIGARPVLISQPIAAADNAAWRRVKGQFYWIGRSHGEISAAMLARLQGIYNERLMRICKEERADCFDLAKAVPHSDLYFDDFVHFSEEGCALVAQKVAEFLLRILPEGDLKAVKHA